MRKCPDCAEENTFESLFCKHCGRCLLAPNPEAAQLSTATPIEHHKADEGIDFYDGHIVRNSGVARPKRRHRTKPAVIEAWLLLLNLLVFILMAYIIIR